MAGTVGRPPVGTVNLQRHSGVEAGSEKPFECAARSQNYSGSEAGGRQRYSRSGNHTASHKTKPKHNCTGYVSPIVHSRESARGYSEWPVRYQPQCAEQLRGLVSAVGEVMK